jgi:hypothetical protein
MVRPAGISILNGRAAMPAASSAAGAGAAGDGVVVAGAGVVFCGVAVVGDVVGEERGVVVAAAGPCDVADGVVARLGVWSGRCAEGVVGAGRGVAAGL